MKEVLILTDDISNFGKYRALLEDAYIEISHRCSIQEAVIFTRHKETDLIIVDLDVPKFTFKHLNSLRKLIKRSKIVNLVSNIAIKALDECLKLECIVIRKPVRAEEFKNHIRSLLHEDDVYDYEFEVKDSCLVDSTFCDEEN